MRFLHLTSYSPAQRAFTSLSPPSLNGGSVSLSDKGRGKGSGEMVELKKGRWLKKGGGRVAASKKHSKITTVGCLLGKLTESMHSLLSKPLIYLNKLHANPALPRPLLPQIPNPNLHLPKQLNPHPPRTSNFQHKVLRIKLALGLRLREVAHTNQSLDAESRYKHNKAVGQDAHDPGLLEADGTFECLTDVVLDAGAGGELGVAVAAVEVVADGVEGGFTEQRGMEGFVGDGGGELAVGEEVGVAPDGGNRGGRGRRCRSIRRTSCSAWRGCG